MDGKDNGRIRKIDSNLQLLISRYSIDRCIDINFFCDFFFFFFATCRSDFKAKDRSVVEIFNS